MKRENQNNTTRRVLTNLILALFAAPLLDAQTVINADTIWNTHQPNLTTNTTFQINDGVTLTGSGVSYGSNGGVLNNTAAITFNGSGSSKLNFLNNTATGTGGALYSGSNININGQYGAIAISSNTAVNNGGALYAMGTIGINTLTSGTLAITNNSGTGGGGALWGVGAVTLSGSYGAINISGNKAFPPASSSAGGAIGSNGKVSITATTAEQLTITNNLSRGSGGAIYSATAFLLSGDYGGILIDSNTTVGGQGGALWGSRQLTIDTVTAGTLAITNNSAGGAAGALYSNTIALSGSYGAIFVDSNTGYIGGALYAGNSININTVTAGTLAITRNISTDNGGAFYSGGTIAISGQYGAINISNNKSIGDKSIGGKGGAFYAVKDVIISATDDFYLINNTATSTNGDGGGIYAGGSYSMTGSYGGIWMQSNTSGANGGAINAVAGININTTTGGTFAITNNTSGSNGGAFYSGSNISISGNYRNILIGSNSVVGTSTMGNGGAFYAANDIIFNANTSGTLAITNNTAYGSGGAFNAGRDIIVGGSAASIYVASNTANNGGAFNAGRNVSVGSNAVFTDNRATIYGGAINATGNVTIGDNSSFTNNYSGTYGGAIATMSGLVSTGTNVVFSNNKVGNSAWHNPVTQDYILLWGRGAAIYVNTGTVSIGASSTFASNFSYQVGGAIAVETGAVTLDKGVTFTDNYTYDDTTHGVNPRGGAIYVGSGSVTGGSDLQFIHNIASGGGSGGGISAGGDVVIGDRARFERNSGWNGGAIYATGNISMGNNVVLLNNNGDDNAGALYSPGAITLGSNAYISGNSAANVGAILGSGLVSIGDSSTISYNVSRVGRGGAIHGGAVILGNDTLVISNTAGDQFGGAILSNSTVDVGNNVRFENNYSAQTGGAIYASGFVTLGSNAVFVSNTANDTGIYYGNGGAITAVGGISIAAGSTFNNNSASRSGGAIYTSGNATFSGNAAFSNNISGNSGGAIYSVGNTEITGNNGSLLIQNNKAGSSGGAFYAGSGIGISGSYGSINFANNLSTASTASKGGGGAIYGNTVQINSNAGSLLFQSNTTINRGGAIYSVTGVAISGSYGKIVIDANEADINGGAIYSDGGGLIISTTTADVLQITNNISKSTTGGGAININGDTQILGSYGSMLLSSNTSVNYNAGLFGVNGSGGSNSVIINTLTSGTMEISKNYAKNEGGIASVKNFTISGSYGDILIASNTGATGNGGGFNTAGDLIVSATSNSLTIKNNYSGKSGGAAYSIGSIAISGNYGAVVISSNTSNNGGGGAFYSGSGININVNANQLAITYNTATAGGNVYGGALNSAAGDLVVSGSYGNIDISNNTSKSMGGALKRGGGGDTGVIKIDTVTSGTLNITNNKTITTAGGAVAYNSKGDIILSGSYGTIHIANNTSTYEGAFAAYAGNVLVNTVTAGDLVMNGNTAGNVGGVIYASGSITLNGSYRDILITNNSAVGSGGAFCNDSGILAVSATTSGTLLISSNTSGNNGGAFRSNSSIVLSGSYGNLTITGNTATNNGGAFYSGSSLSLNMANIGNLTVSNNTATNGQGGAFWAGNGFYLGTVTGTAQFTNNKASSDVNGGFLWINSGTAEFNVAGNGLILLGDANSIANAADSIGGGASSNVLQSNNGTIVYYANNSNYQGDFNLNAGIAQVSSTLNLLGGKLNGSGTLALDNANAKNGGNDFQFTSAQSGGNFNGTVQLQNSSTYTISNVAVGSPTEQLLQNSTLRLSGTGISAVASEINGGMGVLVVDQDNRSIGNLDLAGGKLVVFGKDPVTATSDILNVKQLKSTGAGSVVAVSAATLAGLDTTTTPQQWVGPIFDLSGSLARQIVNATVGVDANVADQGQFALVDITTGSNLTDITNYNFANAGGSVDVGTIHIGYIAQVRTSGSMGLWVTTGVTQIDSTNANELVNISSTQALTPGDQTLAAKLSGTGAGFAFNGGNTITLANLTGDSDYTGTTAISGSTGVKAGADNSLGQTQYLQIDADGSQFNLNGKNQNIGGGLAQGSDALSGSGNLTVLGGTLQVTDANDSFDANVNISGSGGGVRIDNIAAIGNSGTVNFNDPAATLTVNASGTLSKDLNGSGAAIINPGRDVTATGNNSGFSGTFSVLDSGTLHASTANNLGTAAVSGSNGTLQLHGFNDTLANDLQNDLTLQISDNSAVTINRANTLFSGSAIVDTDNQLTLQNKKALNDRPITDNGLVTLDYTGNWNSVISGSGNVQTLQDLTVTTAQTYSGSTIIDAGTLTAGITDAVSTAAMSIASGATFDLNSFNQTVQGLTNNGTVNFGDNTVGNFKTLTVNGNLEGSGKFNMNVAVGTDVTPLHSGDLNGAGDLVIVTGTANGSQQILINRAGGNGNVSGAGLQVLLVQTATSSGSFNGNTDVHQYSGSVDIGMRTANVQQGDLNGANPNNWYLALSATTSGSNGGGHVVLASAAARETAWFDQDTLVKRMGELRLNDGIFSDLKDHDWEAWVRSYGSQYNLGGKVTGFGNYQQMVYGVDLGADKAWNIDKRNVLYTGLFGGYERSDLDFKYNGSNGGMNGYGMGAYATWLHDTGWYADWVGRAMYLDNSFKSMDESFNSMRGSYDGWAAGTSIEFGRQFQFKDGWYAEPQLQASYVHFFGSNYATTGDNAFGINLNDQDSLQLRFGSLFGRTIKLSQNARDRSFIQPYVKIFGMEQISDGGEVITGDGRWRANTDGPSAIIGAGLIYQLDETNQLHLDYEAQFADKYDKPFGINFGYRHQF